MLNSYYKRLVAAKARRYEEKKGEKFNHGKTREIIEVKAGKQNHRKQDLPPTPAFKFLKKYIPDSL
ncbi:MAG: hypothetical protein H8D23_20600 [Candidatus Brocadiales bacterium]|nr:hypothetical protein [Candidatus Brocadiales bacterium]